MNNLTLAYLGDAVYELMVREHLINSGISKVNLLQTLSLNYVSATSQRRILEDLINNNKLSDMEIEIVNRGRNTASHRPKTTDVITYHKATGFECLIGYLYLNGKQRLDEIMKEIL